MSVGSIPGADNSKEVLICHKKDGGSASTIIIGPSKSVLVYALHSLEYVPGIDRFRVFVPILLLSSGVGFQFQQFKFATTSN